MLTKTIQESVGTSAYKNDCVRCGHPLFGRVGHPHGKIPLWCVDTFGRSTSLQDVIVIFASPPQKRAGWLRVRHCWDGVPCFQPAYFASCCKGKWNKTESSFEGRFAVG